MNVGDKVWFRPSGARETIDGMVVELEMAKGLIEGTVVEVLNTLVPSVAVADEDGEEHVVLVQNLHPIDEQEPLEESLEAIPQQEVSITAKGRPPKAIGWRIWVTAGAILAGVAALPHLSLPTWELSRGPIGPWTTNADMSVLRTFAINKRADCAELWQRQISKFVYEVRCYDKGWKGHYEVEILRTGIYNWTEEAAQRHYGKGFVDPLPRPIRD